MLKQNLQRFRLVTFDVTDTLLHLRDPLKQYYKTATECGLRQLDRGQLKLCFRQQFQELSSTHPNFGCQSLGWRSWWQQLVIQTFSCVDAHIPPDQLHTIAEQLFLVFRTSECWQHVDGAKDLVQRVREAGKCVGVISNFDPSLRQVLDVMGLRPEFDFVLTSYEAGVMKPDAAIFHLAIQRLGIAPHEALHIGNKYDLDYEGARNSGWSGLLVDKESSEGKRGGQHAFGSLSEMLQALETQEMKW